MSLTAYELEEKIKQVEKDLRELQGSGGPVEALSTLTSYKEYLKEELEMLRGKK